MSYMAALAWEYFLAYWPYVAGAVAVIALAVVIWNWRLLMWMLRETLQ